MDPFQKPSAGQRFKRPSASREAMLNDVVQLARARNNDGPLEMRDRLMLRIVNVSADPLPQYGIVALGDIVTDPAVNEPGFLADLVFESAPPVAGEVFAVVQNPIPVGGVGNAIITGLTRCRINIGHVLHQYGVPVDDDYDKLASDYDSGLAKILWKEDGTGVKWCLVDLAADLPASGEDVAYSVTVTRPGMLTNGFQTVRGPKVITEDVDPSTNPVGHIVVAGNYLQFLDAHTDPADNTIISLFPIWNQGGLGGQYILVTSFNFLGNTLGGLAMEAPDGSVLTGKWGTLPDGTTVSGGLVTGVGSGSLLKYSAENKDAGTIPAGGVCAVHSSGTGVIKACAADDTKSAVGLMQSSTASTVSGTIQTEGLFTLADWTAVIGAATLTALTPYFVDPATPGMLTATPPTTTGQVNQYVGWAVSTTTLDLQIDSPILL